MPLYRRASGGSVEGALTYKGVWVAGSYPEGSVVKRNGLLFTAKVATSAPPLPPDSNISTDFVGVDYAVSPWAVSPLTGVQSVSTVTGQTIPGETATTAMQMFGVSNSGGGDFNVTLTLAFETTGTIEFQDMCNLETNWDFGSFAIDGAQQHEITGIVDWTQRSYPVAAGLRVFRWRVRGDGGSQPNSDQDRYKVAALRTTGSVIESLEWDQIALTEIPS